MLPDFFYDSINYMFKTKQENPILKLGPNSTGQILYFFGARHANDPSDPQFTQLENLWSEFIINANAQCVVFVESVVRDVPEQLSNAIIQRGEIGAMLWFAHRDDTLAICSEPDDIEQRRALCTQFNSQDVAYTFIVQNLTSWSRLEFQKFDFNEAVKRAISREVKFFEIYGFTTDVAWFFEHHRKLFGEQLLEDKNFLDAISDPRRNDTLVNSIVAARSQMRNEYIAKRFSDAWLNGKSIFIVYGKGHLSFLEPVLRKLFLGESTSESS